MTILERAIAQFKDKNDVQSMMNLLESVAFFAKEKGHFVIPCSLDEEYYKNKDLNKMKADDKSLDDLHLEVKVVEIGGAQYYAVFTNKKEVEKGEKTSAMEYSVEEYLKLTRLANVEGLIINPWSDRIIFNQELIEMVLEMIEKETQASQIYFAVGEADEIDVECYVQKTEEEKAQIGIYQSDIYRIEIGQIHDEMELMNYIDSILELAHEYNIHSIAFPIMADFEENYISTLAILEEWLNQHASYSMAIVLTYKEQKQLEAYKAAFEKLK